MNTQANSATLAMLLDRRAKAGDWNPYALAYALATGGAATPRELFERDGSNARYFGWNDAQWAITRTRCRKEGVYADHSAHMETLATIPAVSAALLSEVCV